MNGRGTEEGEDDPYICVTTTPLDLVRLLTFRNSYPGLSNF